MVPKSFEKLTPCKNLRDAYLLSLRYVVNLHSGHLLQFVAPKKNKNLNYPRTHLLHIFLFLFG